MKIEIEISEKDLKQLIINYIEEKINSPIEEKNLHIQVMSKQNYKQHEWEFGNFRAKYIYDGVLK